MGKKRLPPLPSPDDPVMLAIKQAHKQPQRLSKKETRAFLRSRPPGMIGRGPGARLLTRRGTLVWRKAHGAGADLDRPPIGIEFDRAVQQYETELNKVARAGRWRSIDHTKASAKGVERRQRKAEATRAAVLELAAQHTHRGRNLASFIATRLRNITARRVRQILAEYNTKK